MTAQAHSQSPARTARLYALAHQAGLSHDQVHGEIWARYGLESTKDLTDRHYEAYTRDLEMRARGRRAHENADPGGADNAASYPRLRNKQGCEQLLRTEWPAVFSHPKLARDVTDAIDWIRLGMASGTISPLRLTRTIQSLKKFNVDVVAEAVRIYLERYTGQTGEYLVGIARNLKRAARIEQKRAAVETDAAAKEAQAKQAAEEQRFRSTLAAAGPRPVDSGTGNSGTGVPPVSGRAGTAGVPPASGRPASSPLDSSTLSRCLCNSGALWYRTAPRAPFKSVGCPWCDEGRTLLRQQIATGAHPERLPWEIIRAREEQA